MAVFRDPAHAVQAALDMQRAIQRDNPERDGPPLTLKVGIHYGPCIAVNQNDILDYFGTTANLAARLEKESAGEDVVLSADVWSDARVQTLLREQRLTAEARDTTVRGLSGNRTVYILRCAEGKAAGRSA